MCNENCVNNQNVEINIDENDIFNDIYQIFTKREISFLYCNFMDQICDPYVIDLDFDDYLKFKKDNEEKIMQEIDMYGDSKSIDEIYSIAEILQKSIEWFSSIHGININKLINKIKKTKCHERKLLVKWSMDLYDPNYDLDILDEAFSKFYGPD